MGHKTAVSRPLPASTLLLDRSTPRVNLIQGRRVFLGLRCISHVCEFEDPICVPQLLWNGGVGWRKVVRIYFITFNILLLSIKSNPGFFRCSQKRCVKDIYNLTDGFEIQIEERHISRKRTFFRKRPWRPIRPWLHPAPPFTSIRPSARLPPPRLSRPLLHVAAQLHQGDVAPLSRVPALTYTQGLRHVYVHATWQC